MNGTEEGVGWREQRGSEDGVGLIEGKRYGLKRTRLEERKWLESKRFELNLLGSYVCFRITVKRMDLGIRAGTKARR